MFGLSREECVDRVRKFDYTTLAESVGFMTDMPVYELFLHFYLSFPNAKWILTTRDANVWAEHRKKDHLFSPYPMQEPCGYIVEPQSDEKVMAKAFLLTNDLIRCVVPAEKLLELDLFEGSTNGMMARIAEFTQLHAPEGEEAFPHVAFPVADRQAFLKGTPSIMCPDHSRSPPGRGPN